MKLNINSRQAIDELFNEMGAEYELINILSSKDLGLKSKKTYIEIKHKYCGNIYVVELYYFRKHRNCKKCCQKYENSFAYHIEVELGEPLDKYWDFEKNTVNPYHITKSTDKKVWIKCQEKDYHGSYEIRCDNFRVSKQRCSYCSRKKIHPKDSFAQHHIDNTDKDFLEKYWDWDKNKSNPWEISVYGHNKVWIKCQNEEINELNGLMKKEYHGSYEITPSNFMIGNRCSYCNPTGQNPKVHPYDSFGYHNFDKVLSWHPDNKVSPFKISKNNGRRCKFICEECGYIWETKITYISRGCWCPMCSSSKGEKKIKSWLNKKGIRHIYDESYFKDLVSKNNIPLRPDFILPEHKIWIEYDGEFHFRKVYNVNNYETLKIHDKRKNEYAKKHGWKMIRIPYWEFDNIENILEKEIQ